jgi:hypothetical protein
MDRHVDAGWDASAEAALEGGATAFATRAFICSGLGRHAVQPRRDDGPAQRRRS